MKSRSLSYDHATRQLVEVFVDITPEQQAADAAAAIEVQAEEVALVNERTIGQALDAALANNQAAIAALVAWRTTGPGAGTANLSAAQLSAALRTAADNQVTAFRQINGLIRLLRRRLDTSDLSASTKA